VDLDIQQLAEKYASKSDGELLQLALYPEQLTPEASLALSGELARRGINGREHLDAARHQEEQRKDEIARDTGELFFIHAYGIGRKRFGKAERSYDSDSGIEQFKTTVFVALFWLPLIPTGTYLVERKRGFLSGEINVLKRLPLDWEQVLKVWVVAASILFVLILAFKLLRHLP
jgi:hypothetical protein